MKSCMMLALLLAAGVASAGTVQGQLSADTTWTPTDSPYTLTGDVVIPEGVTLTLQPGTVVLAAATDGQNLGVDSSRVELLVRGTLRVQGTASGPVTFQGASARPDAWYGIRVEEGTTSTLSGALVRDAHSALELTGASTSVTVSSSTLTANTVAASITSGATLLMDHTLVLSNASGVSFSHGNGTLSYDTLAFASTGDGVSLSDTSDVTVRDSILCNNGGTGLNFSSDSKWTISNNDVWGNSNGNYLGAGGGIAPNSESFNPLFVSPSNPRPTSHSPARHAASDGSSDIGALAFTGDPTPFFGGFLGEDTTLSGAQTLEGTLIVPKGITLTLAPGTTLTAATNDATQWATTPNQVALIVRGTLRVQGTASSPVTFQGPSRQPDAWGGIAVTDGTAMISGALIRDARTALDPGGASTVTVSFSTLTGNNMAGYITHGCTFLMDHTQVLSNVYGLLFQSGSTGTLLYNTIAFQKTNGLEIYDDCAVTVRNSLFVQNRQVGVVAVGPSGHLTLSNNDAWGNGQYDYEGVSSAGPDSLSLNPRFVSASDLHLQATSPCRGAGQEGTDMGALPFQDFPATNAEHTQTSYLQPHSGCASASGETSAPLWALLLLGVTASRRHRSRD